VAQRPRIYTRITRRSWPRDHMTQYNLLGKFHQTSARVWGLTRRNAGACYSTAERHFPSSPLRVSRRPSRCDLHQFCNHICPACFGNAEISVIILATQMVGPVDHILELPTRTSSTPGIQNVLLGRRIKSESFPLPFSFCPLQ
jgi:hypothetical protein